MVSGCLKKNVRFSLTVVGAIIKKTFVLHMLFSHQLTPVEFSPHQTNNRQNKPNRIFLTYIALVIAITISD